MQENQNPKRRNFTNNTPPKQTNFLFKKKTTTITTLAQSFQPFGSSTKIAKHQYIRNHIIFTPPFPSTACSVFHFLFLFFFLSPTKTHSTQTKNTKTKQRVCKKKNKSQLHEGKETFFTFMCVE
jgi:hypothetical protein